MKFLKSTFIILFLIAISLGFSKSYTSYSIDNLDFVISLGVDIAESNENNLKVSFEFTKAANYSPDSGSSSDPEPIINTVEAPSIDSAINLMNAHMGKELKLSHCKLVVFSEKIAQKGISDEVYTLVNNIQIRPATNIIVSKCSPEYYLNNLNPSIESYVTKYYEVFPNSGKYTGYTVNATIGEFFYSLSTNTCEPVAILGGITEGDASDSNIENIKAGNVPIRSERKSESMGLAVFKSDKLVGELSATESLSHSIMTGKLNTFLISVPNPDNSEELIDMYLYDDMNTKLDVKIINNSPFVKVNVKLTGTIASTGYSSDYLNDETLKSISNYTSSYLESMISSYLYKTAKQYESDISCIGKRSLNNFSSWSELENYDWKNRFKDSFFYVDVNVNVKSGELISRV